MSSSSCMIYRTNSVAVVKTYDNIIRQNHSPSPFLRLLSVTVTPTTQIIPYVPMWMMIYANDVALSELNEHRKIRLSTEDNSVKHAQMFAGFIQVLT